MLRAFSIVPAGQWPVSECRGTVTLAYDDRCRRRIRIATDNGEDVALDLPKATVLGEGDGIALDGGGYVAVRAAPQDLVEVTAATPHDLARMAWHIGNRHFPCQVLEGRILIPDDHVMVDMLRGLGARLRPIRAPFTPEGGAYAQSGHHDHDH